VERARGRKGSGKKEEKEAGKERKEGRKKEKTKEKGKRWKGQEEK
jgi:hypothetical protein